MIGRKLLYLCQMVFVLGRGGLGMVYQANDQLLIIIDKKSALPYTASES
jgi:hypothetical protein